MAKKINKTTKAEASKPIEQKANVFDFFQETKTELGKIVWPSRQQLISESIAVILMVILVATTISLVDKLFGWGAQQVF
ncbi:MAG: preprotein translocase subunit SecE [Synechococcaceae cyanobacterium RL_1_2]|nr:preprotein translocase subunit SecE [Synechococcaceae cyanobacterium RL_1_2]